MAKEAGSILNGEGFEKSADKDIAQVFVDWEVAVFQDHRAMGEVLADEVEEINRQFRKMRPGKAPDERGIVAESLARRRRMLLEMLGSLFTEVVTFWRLSQKRLFRLSFKKQGKVIK